MKMPKTTKQEFKNMVRRMMLVSDDYRQTHPIEFHYKARVELAERIIQTHEEELQKALKRQAEENIKMIRERKNKINKSLNSFMNTNRFDGKCLNLESVKNILNQNLEQLAKELEQEYLGEK
jgi:predicted GTPase